jgi:hypothetical protein
LVGGTPEVNSGTPLPNFNDGFALIGPPDIGAFELGSSLPHYGPRTGNIFADGFESGDTTAWASRVP